MDLTLSATVMTHDSLETLPRCLAALDFCDEVVVADDFSTDGTWAWLQARSSARIRPYQNRFETFAAQRRFLQSQARGRWLLVVDADEEVSPALAKELREAIATAGADVAGYALRLRTFGPAYWARRPWYDVWQKRLLRADRVQWPESLSIHAPARIDGRLGRLRGPIAHFSFDSARHLLRKQLAYASTVAKESHAKGRRAGPMGALGHGLAAWVKYYFFKGLFRFGASGVFLASSLALQHFLKHTLLWDLGQGRPASERPRVPGD